MFTRVRIQANQIGLRFRHGDFAEVLRPGVHFVPGRLFGIDRVEVFDRLESRFEHPLLELLAEDERLSRELHVVDLADDQRGLVWKDGRLVDIVDAGRHAFWKGPARVEVEVRSTREVRFEHEQLEAVMSHPKAPGFLRGVHVDPGERVFFFVEGRFVAEASEGLTVFWKQFANLTWRAVDLKEQILDVAGQEIMTADRVTLRLNAVVTYRVVEPLRTATVVGDAGQALYREVQLALRAAVGVRDLDALLADKSAIADEARAAVAERAAGLGLEILGLGLRDVILPGDMKTILNQVIEAQKEAEANLIRRREETAAARSQANTARLLEQHPALARMKELEALKEILNGAQATFVLGGSELVGQVRRLTESPDADATDEK